MFLTFVFCTNDRSLYTFYFTGKDSKKTRAQPGDFERQVDQIRKDIDSVRSNLQDAEKYVYVIVSHVPFNVCHDCFLRQPAHNFFFSFHLWFRALDKTEAMNSTTGVNANESEEGPAVE